MVDGEATVAAEGLFSVVVDEEESGAVDGDIERGVGEFDGALRKVDAIGRT